MKQFLAAVSDIQLLTPGLQLLTLAAPELTQLQAGQLLLARAPGQFTPYLRAPFFPIPSADASAIIARSDIPPGDAVARRPYTVGDSLDVLAPVGHGFRLDASTRRLLLVGEEPDLAPLIALAHAATRKQVAVTLLIRAGSDAPAGLLSLQRAFGSLLPLAVEYQVMPHLDLGADLLRWCDQLCAAASNQTYVYLKECIARASVVRAADFAQVVVTPPMACGFGACLGCAVETTRHMRLGCVDGPVFDLMQLVL